MPHKQAKPYPAEFKESAVKLAVESDNSITQVAKELGINVNTMHTWVRQYSKPKSKEAGTREMIYHFDENKQLKKELAKVTQERDLLKKAAAYFARESQ
jgi:transposase